MGAKVATFEQCYNAEKRRRLRYPHHHRLTLEATEINFDKYIVYTGMILRNDHPEYDELLNAYREFVKRANNLYQVQSK